MVIRERKVMSSVVKWAVITPSYKLDFERCKLLCRSMDQFLTGSWHHYIVVDPVDLKLFRPLDSARRTIVNKADILPATMRYIGKIPFMRLGRMWWLKKHGPILGWQMQQFVKMFMANYISQDAMLFCDLDIFFVRHFDLSTFVRGHAIRFTSGEDPELQQADYIENSFKLLGLTTEQVSKFSIKEQLITWHRQTVIDMLNYLSTIHSKPWHEVIGTKLMFTEYNMYTAFIHYIQKDNPHLFTDNSVY
jgi:hypothetical protein